MKVERKLSHIAIDQMIYSGGNFAVALIVGLSLPTADFGRFILVQAALQLTLQVSRGFSGDPILAAGRSDLRGSGAMILAGALTFALLLLPVGVVLLLAGQQFAGATALLLSAGCAFEGVRQQLLVTDQLKRLVVGDSLWSGLSILGLAALAASTTVSLANVLFIWAGAAAAAAVLTAAVRPNFTTAAAYLKSERRSVTSFVTDNVLSRGAPSLALLIIGAVVAERDMGLIGIGRTLAAPVQVVFAAAVSYGVVKFAGTGSSHRQFPMFRRGGIGVGTIGGLAVLAATPLAALLFDENASDIWIFSALWAGQLVVASVIQVERVRVRVDGQTEQARVAMIGTSAAVVAGAGIGVLLAGPAGGLGGLVAGTAIGTLLWRRSGSAPAPTQTRINA